MAETDEVRYSVHPEYKRLPPVRNQSVLPDGFSVLPHRTASLLHGSETDNPNLPQTENQLLHGFLSESAYRSVPAVQ